ncbi:MAG TPA: DoxX family protein [Vicinamibacterales bacterium]|nr:DoxX family protein [Vicinamibacterales bacterium]
MRISLYTSPTLQRYGTTILRVVVGLVFVAHGLQKLFVTGLAGVAGFMSQVGIPLPMASAVLVTAVETLCGLALVAGFLTRWAAIPLAINMLVAAAVVHLPAGFFLPNGYEYALTLLAACASISLLGPGAFAVDNLIAGTVERGEPTQAPVATPRAA